MEKTRKVLLKLSGEALAGASHTGFDLPTVQNVAGQVKQAVDEGVRVGVVIAGGISGEAVPAMRLTGRNPIRSACLPR